VEEVLSLAGANAQRIHRLWNQEQLIHINGVRSEPAVRSNLAKGICKAGQAAGGSKKNTQLKSMDV